MKLLRATVRHYRTHRDTSVSFDGSSTLITGPNEAGKSTFVEAVHRALFLKGKISGNLLDEMKSLTHPGDPFVSVTFLDDTGACCTIEKTFGRNATRLIVDGADTLTGDAAEEALARRLGVVDTITGSGGEKRLAARWAHLWVRQGTSGSEPFASVEEESRQLFERLRQLGGAALQASALDTALRHRFIDASASLWTSKDKAKSGSPLHNAIEAESRAARAATEASAQVTRLETAIADSLEAEKCRLEKLGAKSRLEPELAQTRESLQRLAKIDNDLTLQETRISPARAELASLNEGERAIDAKRLTLKGAEANVAKAAASLAPAKHAAQAHAEALVKARRARDAAAHRAQSTRSGAEKLAAAERLARAQVTLHEAEHAHAGIEKHRKHLTEEEAALAAMPSVSRQKLNALATKAADVTKAEAIMQAMGARLHVIATGKQAVHLDGKHLAAGSDVTITDTAELTVGDSVRLSLSPGGAGSLRDARLALENARKALADALAAIPASGIEEASELAELHASQQAKVKTLSEHFEKLNPETLDKRLKTARQEHESARLLAARLGVSAEDAGDAESRDAALEARNAAEAAESQALAELKVAESRAEQAENSLRDAESAANAAHAAEGAARSALTTLLTSFGDDDARAQRRVELTARIQTADDELRVLRAERELLNPEVLANRAKRQSAALEQLGIDIAAAHDKKTSALALLRSDGTSDPVASSEIAARTAERAKRLLDSERTHAEAIALLARLFVEQNSAVAEQGSRPLAEAADRYLACVHGTGAKLRLALDSDGSSFSGATLARPDNTSFPFEALSGGAREQVGVALRLAMTETLAATHGKSLPVVLDDAFVNSDADRVRAIRDMLDLAAHRGLQVIVLSCHPDQYDGMGWPSHRLVRTAPSGFSAPTASSPESENEPAEPAIPGNPADLTNRILEILRRKNDLVSMRALREELGCELPELQAARDSLVAQGAVVPEGKSLRLAGSDLP